MDRHQFTVYFSIDGDEEHHDELRKYIKGGGSFADVERNLRYLRTRPGVHLIGSSVIRKGFALQDALKHLAGHGAQQCKAERVRLHRGEALSLEDDDHDDYLRDIEGLIDHYVDHLEAGRKPMDFRLSSKILQVYTRTRRSFFCPGRRPHVRHFLRRRNLPLRAACRPAAIKTRRHPATGVDQGKAARVPAEILAGEPEGLPHLLDPAPVRRRLLGDGRSFRP